MGGVLLQVESRLAWAEVRAGQGPDREHRLYLGVLSERGVCGSEKVCLFLGLEADS